MTTRSYKIKKPSKKSPEEIKKLNGYLETLNDWEAELLDLQTYLQENPTEPSLLAQLKNCLFSYDGIKKLLKEELKIDVDKIEKSVIEAALKDETFKKLLFYPDYQANYDFVVNDFETRKELTIFTLEYDRQTISQNYAVRKKNHIDFCERAAIASIAVVGLPFLVYGLLVALADALITKIRLFVNEREAKHARSQCEIGIANAQANTIGMINTDLEARVQQGFFTLAKTRHDPKFKNITDQAIESAAQEERLTQKLA